MTVRVDVGSTIEVKIGFYIYDNVGLTLTKSIWIANPIVIQLRDKLQLTRK